MKFIVLLFLATAALAQTPAALREDITYLASEELEGRATPSAGLDLAAHFIAEKFGKIGLRPADHGGYLQGEDAAKGPWNVVGILPGSDPKLSQEFVILSAHYDHVGRRKGELYPGANDDASGTASVMEIAAAIAAGPTRPKRSILFMTFFGEERGLLGSKYYVEHPVVPLKRSIVEINLEQLGRTDETTGAEVAAFGMTGTSFSNLPQIIGGAAKKEGVTLYHRPDEDDFFRRSDNYRFAAKGVVDTTIAVAFDFPDYHKPGDIVDKIDFENLALVDRAVAAAVLQLADDPVRPVWTKKPPIKKTRAHKK